MVIRGTHLSTPLSSFNHSHVIRASSLEPAVKHSGSANHASVCSKGVKESISEMFTKVELSVSSYDTAWVAMVPSPNSSLSPCFPECLNWLLDNQLPNGSWGLHHSHPFLIKDALSSTLASILALKRWNVGEEHVKNGIHFITSNFSSATDERQHTPIGFDIIFPGMIEHAQGLGLNLHLGLTALDSIFHKRDLDLNRCSGSNDEGRSSYLAYVAEGLGKSLDWEFIMKHQRKNGSLFNSPSTTAAALTHLQDINCLNYLESLLKKFGNAVPTAYPLEIYTQLCLVDSLQRLGIGRHFRDEVRSVLDKTYRCWLQMNEEIFLDTATCSLAFRILRMHGYDISSDALVQFGDEKYFSRTIGGYLKDTGAVLELYRASNIGFANEFVLEKQNSWSSDFLKRELSSGLMYADRLQGQISQEVDDVLNYPYYANLESLEHRINIKSYNIDNLRILKTSYRPVNVDYKDILKLAVEDFHNCQLVHQKELKQLERWYEENQLDKLMFARQKLPYCYFSAAATLFPPELSDARLSWAKNAVLTTVVDDFFDIGGSQEELLNLIASVRKWDGVLTTDFCSKKVEIIFSVLRNTVNELGEKAFKYQGRSVRQNLTEMWLWLLTSMMKEAEWTENKSVPTMEEYIENAYVSLALGPIVLPALYFIGPHLSEEIVMGAEYHNLFRLMSTCGRLLNDIQGFKRESKEGKLNSVSLLMIHNPAINNTEEAERELRGVIDCSRKELLRLVLQTNGSGMPRACKDVFWKMCKVVHLFYMSEDGFTSQQLMFSAVNAVLNEPLVIPDREC